MKNIFRFARKNLAGLVISSCLLLNGCEWGTQYPDPKTADDNYGQGRENFSISPASSHMHSAGQISEVAVAVNPDRAYTVTLECNNDGDRDKVAIIIDEKNLGTYVTAENREGGSGWYDSQYAGPYHIISTGETMNLQAKVLSTDSYGVWARKWIVSQDEQ
jgi:hypothetical protein